MLDRAGPVYVGVAAGVGGGVSLGLLEGLAALIRSGELSLQLLGWILAIDVCLAVSIGLVVGVLSLPVPRGQGPLARLRRFAAGGPGAPQVRGAAFALGAAVFIHGSIFLGQRFAGRFHNASLAAFLLLSLQAALLIPSVAVGRLTERLLVDRDPLLPALVVFAAAGTLGAALAPYLDLLELSVFPLVFMVAWAAWAAGEGAASRLADPLRTAAATVVGVLGGGGLSLLLTKVGAPVGADLAAYTFVAGWLSGL